MNEKELDDVVAQYVFVWYHLKHEICNELFEQSVTKIIDHYNSLIFLHNFCYKTCIFKNKQV